MSKAQDNIREDLQKKRFGLTGDHTRDDKYDAFYKMPIEFKTKAQDKGCTTKRRYVDDPFKACVLVVSDYINKDTLSDTDWIIFPLALKEWRDEQERKLEFDNGTIPCYNEVDKVMTALGVTTTEIAHIMSKFRNQVHRNNSAIPKRFFDSDGQFTSINRKKIKVQHSEWAFRVPNNVDKATFLRDKINLYLNRNRRTDGKSQI